MRERNCLISLTKKGRGEREKGGEERESDAAELHRTQPQGDSSRAEQNPTPGWGGGKKEGSLFLFHKHEIDSGNKAGEGCEMIPMKTFALEQHVGNDGKDDERNALLNNLELNKSEGSAVAHEAYTIGWHLTAIFEERYQPAEYNNTKQRPV